MLPRLWCYTPIQTPVQCYPLMLPTFSCYPPMLTTLSCYPPMLPAFLQRTVCPDPPCRILFLALGCFEGRFAWRGGATYDECGDNDQVDSHQCRYKTLAKRLRRTLWYKRRQCESASFFLKTETFKSELPMGMIYNCELRKTHIIASKRRVH